MTGDLAMLVPEGEAITLKHIVDQLEGESLTKSISLQQFVTDGRP